MCLHYVALFSVVVVVVVVVFVFVVIGCQCPRKRGPPRATWATEVFKHGVAVANSQ